MNKLLMMFAGLKWGKLSAFTSLYTSANERAGSGTGTVCPVVNCTRLKQTAATLCSGLPCAYGRRK
jgi:hypothetical protein